jgi:hypothetical protein
MKAWGLPVAPVCVLEYVAGALRGAAPLGVTVIDQVHPLSISRLNCPLS